MNHFSQSEDINLSYRIQKRGFENWYLGSVKILHYKGESTNELSFRYIKNFYGAMRIFVKKHFALLPYLCHRNTNANYFTQHQAFNKTLITG